MKPSDDDVDALLAKDRLSGRQYDEVWNKVLENVETAPPRPRRWAIRPFLLAAGALSGAVAGWLMLASPKTDPFAARGGGTAAGGAFSIGCASSWGARCRVGETLMFSANGALASGVLGAYAERIDAPGSGRIWYFPDDAGTGPEIPSRKETVVLSRGIQIGPEQPPGRYRVTIWAAPRPMHRAELEGGALEAIATPSTLDLEVVP